MNAAVALVGAAAIGLTAGAGGATFMLARARRGVSPLDLPDARRLHAAPTPRGGGIGLAIAGVAALLLALSVAAPAAWRPLAVLVLVWAVPTGVLGIVDDHRALPTRLKLGVQLAAAIVAVSLGLRTTEIVVPLVGTLGLGPAAGPFAVLWLVWMANVFNFMDGMDALAAECGSLFFGALAGLALLAGASGHAVVAVAIAGALLGFLRYNLPPARIFMGDGGSLFAGALLGGLTLTLARTDVAGVPLAASAVLLGSFAFDATFTVVRRAVRGLALRPHRTHFYQRLALAGWSHHRVRLLYLALTAAGVVGAFTLQYGPPIAQAAVLIAIPVSLLSTVVVTRRAERRGRSQRT